MYDERASQLLADYNTYRNQTENVTRLRKLHPIRDIGPIKGLPLVSKMDLWCVARGIDPRRWLYWLFARTGFRFAPKLTQLTPSSKRENETLAKYKNLRGTPQFTDRIFREVETKRAQAGQIFDPNRDLSYVSESMKRRYLLEGRPDKCISDMFSNRQDTVPTWGYHPKSLSCVRCPLARQCEMTLRASVPTFDIVALRLGQITLQTAQIMDGRAYNGR